MDLRRLFAFKPPVDLSHLESSFTIDELKLAVFELGRDKAPGLDGFPLLFFREFWDLTKDDLWKLCVDFFDGKVNLERINWASLTLIPKVDTPESLGDFRPISLTNSILKIISKMLASRLSKVLNRLIESEQSAFMKGRCILDNIATTKKLIFSMNRHCSSGHILKVDFAKVSDTVDWEFLWDLLLTRGFGRRWVGWIQCLLTTLKASILINGSPNGYIQYQKGLCQLHVCSCSLPW